MSIKKKVLRKSENLTKVSVIVICVRHLKSKKQQKSDAIPRVPKTVCVSGAVCFRLLLSINQNWANL
jgi:hypothetical protein